MGLSKKKPSGGGEETKSEKIPLGELKISCLMEEGGGARGVEEGSPPKAAKKIINDHLCCSLKLIV